MKQWVVLGLLGFFTLPSVEAGDLQALREAYRETLWIPMRDGARLATDLYLPPAGEGPWPTILVRTPYGRKLGDAEPLVLALLTEAFVGYALVIQDTRGRGDSEGIDSLFFSDGWGRLQDGYDTVEWIAAQPWSNGKVGMWGPSALGIVQYLAAGAAPPHLVCGCALVATGNLYEHALFQGGAYRKALVDGWLHRLRRDSLRAYFIRHPLYGPGYERVNLSTRYDLVRVPFLHIGGWHDIFTQGTIDAFVGLHHHGGEGARGRQKLIMGPWIHNLLEGRIGELAFPDASPLLFLTDMIAWFDQWLKEGSSTAYALPAVRVYLMGDADHWKGLGNRWLSFEDWPPAYTPVAFYLRAGGLLSPHPPTADEPPDRFVYDPDHPVPTHGGRNLFLPAGSFDQRAVEDRPDVLVYTSAPLSDTLIVVGPVSVVLYAASDALDTDFTAKLCDVYPDGRSMLVADGIIRARSRESMEEEVFLQPGAVVRYRIDLWSTAVAFAPGHRVRLSIASSNDPRFDPNPNTGEPFGRHTGIRLARQEIHHDLAFPSALMLPVLSWNETRAARRDVATNSITLGPNHPNPFNAGTWIPFSRDPRDPSAKITLWDLAGRLVRRWRSGDWARGGVFWDGRDEAGREAPSGMYLVRLVSGRHEAARKITLIR